MSNKLPYILTSDSCLLTSRPVPRPLWSALLALVLLSVWLPERPALAAPSPEQAQRLVQELTPATQLNRPLHLYWMIHGYTLEPVEDELTQLYAALLPPLPPEATNVLRYGHRYRLRLHLYSRTDHDYNPALTLSLASAGASLQLPEQRPSADAQARFASQQAVQLQWEFQFFPRYAVMDTYPFTNPEFFQLHLTAAAQQGETALDVRLATLAMPPLLALNEQSRNFTANLDTPEPLRLNRLRQVTWPDGPAQVHPAANGSLPGELFDGAFRFRECLRADSVGWRGSEYRANTRRLRLHLSAASAITGVLLAVPTEAGDTFLSQVVLRIGESEASLQEVARVSLWPLRGQGCSVWVPLNLPQPVMGSLVELECGHGPQWRGMDLAEVAVWGVGVVAR